MKSIAEKLHPHTFTQEPQEIYFEHTSPDTLSIMQIQKMINARIKRDAHLLEPVLDYMTHL